MQNNLLRCLTQKEVAAIFGISKHRVAQIEERALWKLQQALLEDPELKDYAEEVFLDPHTPRSQPIRERTIQKRADRRAKKRAEKKAKSELH